MEKSNVTVQWLAKYSKYKPNVTVQWLAKYSKHKGYRTCVVDISQTFPDTVGYFINAASTAS